MQQSPCLPTDFDTLSKALVSVFHQAPVAICIVEMPALKYVSANHNYCRIMSGHILPETIRNVPVLDIIQKPNSTALQALYTAHEKNESTHFETIESCIQAPELTYWTGTILPYHRDHEKTLVIGLLYNVTDTVKAKKEAQASLELLEEERRLKDQFIAMAIHELRTPLTAIKAFAQMILKQNERQNKQHDVQSALQKINKHSDRLNQLISDLQDVVNCSAHEIQVDLRLCSFSKLISNAVKDFSDSYPQSPVEIVNQCQDEAFIQADPDRFNQVLLNLLVNACKYSAPGSPILVTIRCSDSVAQVEVNDQGIGIAPENLQKIFEIFYRASPEKYSNGLGIGLYLARQLLEQMSGTISAESKGLERGSTFIVKFRLKNPAPFLDESLS